jgi:hypothetical protein
LVDLLESYDNARTCERQKKLFIYVHLYTQAHCDILPSAARHYSLLTLILVFGLKLLNL